MICYVTLCHVMPCHAMSCHVMLCCVVLCCVVLCCVMLCCVVLCHVMLFQNFLKNATKIDTDASENLLKLIHFEESWGSSLGVRGVLGALCASKASRDHLGGSWALSWAVLGANLEPRWPPRERQKQIKMLLKIEPFFDTLWHLHFFRFFMDFGCQDEVMLVPKREKNPWLS